MNNKHEIPIEWFACPITKEKLTSRHGALFSSLYKWERMDGVWNFIPDMLPELKEGKWQIWEQLQTNAQIPYTQFPEDNLGVGKRDDFLEFAEFCEFRGKVLDIGVGPQRIPTHIEYCTKNEVIFIGMDPLLGVQPRDFAFVLGLGEYVPFRDHLFDQVLYVTSLDHFIDPIVTLKEAMRVLRPDGDICVWLGEKHRNAPPPMKQAAWYEKLTVPEGAEDRFHYKRMNYREFVHHISNLNLAIIEQEKIQVGEWRNNYFFKCRAGVKPRSFLRSSSERNSPKRPDYKTSVS